MLLKFLRKNRFISLLHDVATTNAMITKDKRRMNGEITFSNVVITGFPNLARLLLCTTYSMMTGIVIPRAVQATPPTRPTSVPKDGILAPQNAAAITYAVLMTLEET